MTNVTKIIPFHNPVGMSDPANLNKYPVPPLTATALNVKAPGPRRNSDNRELGPSPHGDAIVWIELDPHGEYVASHPASTATPHDSNDSATADASARPTPTPPVGNAHRRMPLAHLRIWFLFPEDADADIVGVIVDLPQKSYRTRYGISN